jgi:hypothetical protein
MSFEDDVFRAVNPVGADAIETARNLASTIAAYHQALLESGMPSHLADALVAQYQQMFLMAVRARCQEKEEDNRNE